MLGAIDLAARETSRPTLIIVESHIGYGAPHKQDTAEAHGEPLGEEEVRATKMFYGWPADAQFLVPDGVEQHFADGVGARGTARHKDWEELFARYRVAYPELAAQFDLVQKRELPPGWDQAIPSFPPDPKGIASRDSQARLRMRLRSICLGSSAARRISPHRLRLRMTFEGAGDFEPDNHGGRNFHFGIREHAMGAVVNGMALAKLRPFGSGFLIFSDYMRNPIRLAAIMELPALYIFTHEFNRRR